MIRRNYIQAVPKIILPQSQNRPQQKYKQNNHQNSLAKRQACKLQLQSAVDENNRFTSNKKYHQYKNWKEQHKIVPLGWVDWEDDYGTKKIAGNQNQYHLNQKNQNKLKRQYEYDSNQPLNIDYDSIKIRKPNKSIVQPIDIQQKRSFIADNKSNNNKISWQNSGKISHKVSTDTVNSGQSPKRKASYQSNHKFNQQFDLNCQSKKPTTFLQSSRIINHKQSSNQHKNSYKSYNLNQNFINRTKYHNAFQDKRKSLQSKNHKQKQISQNCIQHNTSTKTYKSQGKTEVSEKLKMISDFNDQINERIKKIIVCFQGLKQKL